MADQASVVAELYRRIDTLDPDRQSVVKELAKRFNIGAPQQKVPGMEKLGGTPPGMPKPPQPQIPEELAPQYDPSFKKDFGIMSGPMSGVYGAVRGVERMAEPGMREKAGAAHEIASGVAQASTPFVAASGVAAPIKTARAIVSGLAAQKGVSSAAKAVGVPEEYADVAGDVAAIPASAAGYKTSLADVQNAGSLAKGFAKGAGAEAMAPQTRAAMKTGAYMGGIAGEATGGHWASGAGLGGAAGLATQAPRIVRGGMRGARQVAGDIAAKARIGEQNTPIWQGMPEGSAPPVPDATPIAADLPSGRKAGPAPPVPSPQRTSLPERANVQSSPPPAPDVVEPIKGDLPSGRKVGGIQNQQSAMAGPPPAPEPAGPSEVELDQVARSLSGQRFKTLTPERQKVVRDVASKAFSKSEPPPAPEPQVAAAVPAPVAATPRNPVETPAIADDPGRMPAQTPPKWPQHILTDQTVREHAASFGVPESEARQALVQGGYQVMNRAEVNRLVHSIGQEMGLDHAALSDAAKMTYKVKSLSQVSENQLLDMYHDLLSKRAAKDPLTPKTGEIRMFGGRPVRVIRLYPDGSADVEPVQ